MTSASEDEGARTAPSVEFPIPADALRSGQFTGMLRPWPVR